MSYWHPHLTRQLPLEIGPQATTSSLSIVPATGASFPTTFSGDQNYGTVGANTLRTAAQVGNATGAADFGSGVPGAQTLRTVTATVAATFQSAGAINGSALTGSYQTVLTLTADAVCLAILNTCNNTIFVSLDGGTSDTLKLESGESLTLDFGTNGRKVSSGALIQAKHAGAAPASGTLRVSRLG